jgi:hypothetical protein
MRFKLHGTVEFNDFFSKFPLDYRQIAGFIFKLFFVSGGQWYLSMDRTNWRWGNSDINILMLGIVFKGTAIPIYWMLLDKRGNSDTPERMALIQIFIDHFGKNCLCTVRFLKRSLRGAKRRSNCKFRK